jgi:hypothetical protein
MYVATTQNDKSTTQNIASWGKCHLPSMPPAIKKQPQQGK